MLEKIIFYTKHSLNDLRVNGQRTVFALLCIAAGVAAIVSLQTLAVMIGDTLTGNLQATNRGDISITTSATEYAMDATKNASGDDISMADPGNQQRFVNAVKEASQRGQDEGVYEKQGVTSGVGEDYFSPEGLKKIQEWIDAHYPGQIQMTYRQPLTNTIGVFTGGTGTSVTAVASGNPGNNVTPIMVDVTQYPLYGTITSQDGQSLMQMIKAPTDIVLSRNLGDTLQVKVGDKVRINGSEADFTVRGIVPTDTEGGFQNIFLGLFGFYYLDANALSLFPDAKVRADMLYLKLKDPTQTAAVDAAFKQAFPYTSTQNTDDLLKQNTQASDALNKLVSIMGLVSLLLGGIGIVNTMQVIVRRRTLEVAVLKTLGLQANQITILFLVEAFLMGIIGSAAGIVLGWVMTFVIKGTAEAFLAQALPFRITPGPALNGLLVGTLVTTIFGFLPTLAAGQVRPGVVLRPNDEVVPRNGCLATLGALLVVILALSVVANGILGNFVLSLEVMIGTFLVAGFLYLLLLALIWLVGRFMPSFGIVDLKVSLRAMLAGRRRGATTLLALAIGVFSLSLITLLSDSVNRMIGQLLINGVGGNVIIQTAGGGAVNQVDQILSSQAGVKSFSLNRNYAAKLVSVEDGETGKTISADELKQRLVAGKQDPQSLDGQFGSVTGRDVTSNLPQLTFDSGRQLTAADAGKAVMVMKSTDATQAAGLKSGDKLTFEVGGGGPLGFASHKETITFELVGLSQPSNVGANFDNGTYAPKEVFPDSVVPNSLSAIVDIDEAQIPALRKQMSAIPGVFLLETKQLNKLITSLLGQLTSFPLLVAALGLIVGGIVIANSVALSTLERRREIAIMKAVGLQRERVLTMLLLENGVLGLIGGLIGVGIGLIALILMLATMTLGSGSGIDGNLIPYGTALLLMGLCIVVALIAALTTAWSASGEKPLNVLRYE